MSRAIQHFFDGRVEAGQGGAITAVTHPTKIIIKLGYLAGIKAAEDTTPRPGSLIKVESDRIRSQGGILLAIIVLNVLIIRLIINFW